MSQQLPPKVKLGPNDLIIDNEDPLNDIVDFNKPGFKKAIGEGIKELRKCHSSLNITNQYLESCQNTEHPTTQWFQEPEVIIAGVAVSFGVGAFFAASKCLGMCK